MRAAPLTEESSLEIIETGIPYLDAILGGDLSDSLLSRASALGWSDPAQVIVIAGGAPGFAANVVASTTCNSAAIWSWPVPQNSWQSS